MGLLPLIVEGIENKIKKLVYQNEQLHQQNAELKRQLEDLKSEKETLTAHSRNLEDQISKLKVAKSLTGRDHFQARQQINEMLREIERCYALLNR